MQMQRAKYTAEFKEEAVRQVVDRGHSVIDVAKRLGVGDGLLYTWVKKFKAANEPVAIDDMKSMQAELNRLKAELRRTTEERDILKKAALSSTGRCNTCCESSAWRFKVQRLSRPGIQFQSNGIELKLVER